MKRIMAVFLLTVLIVSSFCVNEVSAAEVDETLIVGFDAEFPPYGYKDDNGAMGCNNVALWQTITLG